MEHSRAIILSEMVQCDLTDDNENRSLIARLQATHELPRALRTFIVTGQQAAEELKRNAE